MPRHTYRPNHVSRVASFSSRASSRSGGGSLASSSSSSSSAAAAAPASTHERQLPQSPPHETIPLQLPRHPPAHFLAPHPIRLASLFLPMPNLRMGSVDVRWPTVSRTTWVAPSLSVSPGSSVANSDSAGATRCPSGGAARPSPPGSSNISARVARRTSAPSAAPSTCAPSASDRVRARRLTVTASQPENTRHASMRVAATCPPAYGASPRSSHRSSVGSSGRPSSPSAWFSRARRTRSA
mmetsp:Transcript_5821/g.25803  ORF Transcript_5821/g.25803 Transcript_5821/m.25803 type:complete len:240 (+) Transcript_5821:2780-3499(+)